MDPKEEMAVRKRGQTPLGVSADNFPTIFALHTHDGTPTGGRQIYLPIFARDTTNGHTYRIDSTGGVLVLTQLT